MLLDIVIDANVFLHSYNPASGRQTMCRTLLGHVKNCDVHICVDEGFDSEEARNRSQIGAEYIKHLKVGTVAYELVAYLAKSGRIDIVPKSVPQTTARLIHRQVTKGPDRTYLKVAYNSREKILASHDYEDIPDTVRVRLKKQLMVKVVSAEVATAALEE
jgi:hypothetical protein